MTMTRERELNILGCNTVGDLRSISLAEFFRYYPSGVMTQPEIEHIFRVNDALWLHSGDPKNPHAELTSGMCSDGFVDTLRVLRNTNLCAIFAYILHQKVILHHNGENIDWVIGSDHAGATLSYRVAEYFNAQHDFTEKGPDKSQVWKRFEIQPKEMVLQIEELITTTSTLQAVRDGIREGTSHKVKFAPVIGTLIHRSDTYNFEGAPIVYLAHFDINVWEPEECPLCAAGSERIRPKQNWVELTA